MVKGKKLIRLALFGRPVKSSLSPYIHRMFADQLGLDIDYQLIDVGQNGFLAALEDFRSAGGAGCNITVPLKGAAWQAASESSPQVALAQAANTLLRQPTGWFAHNTDGDGLIADLVTNHSINLSGKRILLLGAGGASAGIMASLLAHAAGELVLVNRNEDRAQALADRFSMLGDIRVINWPELAEQGSFDLVINATSLGHQGEAPPLVHSVFAPDTVCYDLNYHAASLPLKELCEKKGNAYIDGLGMLVEQAAKSFCIWTGKQPESRIVIEQLRSDAPQT